MNKYETFQELERLRNEAESYKALHDNLLKNQKKTLKERNEFAKQLEDLKELLECKSQWKSGKHGTTKVNELIKKVIGGSNV